jgi:hypothetical protein
MLPSTVLASTFADSMSSMVIPVDRLDRQVSTAVPHLDAAIHAVQPMCPRAPASVIEPRRTGARCFLPPTTLTDPSTVSTVTSACVPSTDLGPGDPRWTTGARRAPGSRSRPGRDRSGRGVDADYGSIGRDPDMARLEWPPDAHGILPPRLDDDRAPKSVTRAAVPGGPRTWYRFRLEQCQSRDGCQYGQHGGSSLMSERRRYDSPAAKSNLRRYVSAR